MPRRLTKHKVHNDICADNTELIKWRQNDLNTWQSQVPVYTKYLPPAPNMGQFHATTICFRDLRCRLSEMCYRHMVYTYFFPVSSIQCIDRVASIPKNLRAFESQRFAGDC